jgi:hypothetical protein
VGFRCRVDNGGYGEAVELKCRLILEVKCWNFGVEVILNVTRWSIGVGVNLKMKLWSLGIEVKLGG